MSFSHFRGILFLALLSIPHLALSYTFSEAIEKIKKHHSVESLHKLSQSLEEKGKVKGSWGDPVFKLAAKNFPKDSLKDNETPVTGIEMGLSQKISLTSKYENIKDAYEYLGKAKRHDSETKVQMLVQSFWGILVESKKLDEEIAIFKENLNWIKNILKISKRLYENGKITQQALLDIQIRKSEIEASLSNKNFESIEQQDRLTYVLGLTDDEKILKESIPWPILQRRGSQEVDTKELSLKSVVVAKSKMLAAKKLDYIPDFTLSVGYTKRANIDNKGDFLSASVSFPLPFSKKKYSSHSQAVFDKASAQKELVNYQQLKESEARRLKHQIERQKAELKILSDKTIKFAENSRKITSKSYGLGSSSYLELLQSEFKLQSLLIKRSHLNALLLKVQTRYKYLIGENLYE
jgi:outer membrane protein, heavy metal efflux system